MDYIDDLKNIIKNPPKDLPTKAKRYLSSVNLSSGTLTKETIQYIGSKLVRIDGKMKAIVINDGTVDRFILGKDKSGTYVIKLSIPGINVWEATNSQLLYSTELVFFQTVISMPSVTPLSDFLVTTGLVWYDSVDELNFAPLLSFYKETDWTLTTIKLRTLFTDARAFNGIDTWNTVRPQNVYIRLNPTKSAALGNTVGGHSYYTYSAGTALESNFTPNADQYIKDHVFSAAEIALVSDGWNRIVIQQEVTSTTLQGYVDGSLVLRGYITL